MLNMRQRQRVRQKERQRGRRKSRRRFLNKTGWEKVITSSWMPPSPQTPKGEQKPLQYSPTPTHKGLHHSFNTPPNMSNTINRFLLGRREKDSSGGTTKSRKFPTNPDLKWRPLWAGRNPLQEELERSLTPSPPNNTTQPVSVIHESWPTSTAFTCFSPLLLVWYTGNVRKISLHFFLQGFLVYWIKFRR